MQSASENIDSYHHHWERKKKTNRMRSQAIMIHRSLFLFLTQGNQKILRGIYFYFRRLVILNLLPINTVFENKQIVIDRTRTFWVLSNPNRTRTGSVDRSSTELEHDPKQLDRLLSLNKLFLVYSVYLIASEASNRRRPRIGCSKLR